MFAANYIANWGEAKAHILARYPQEAGGYVGQDNVFVPVENVADDPLLDYVFHPQELIGVDVKCILHSHPYEGKPDLDPRTPSKQDLMTQDQFQVEFAIAATDGTSVMEPVFWGDPAHRPPLRQREFIHGVQDCLTFVADWYYAHFKMVLPSLVRHPEQEDFREDQALLLETFDDVSHLPEEKGDILFLRMGSREVTHIGVVVEPNMASHHVNNGFPKSEPTPILAKYTVKRIRHRTSPGSK